MTYFCTSENIPSSSDCNYTTLGPSLPLLPLPPLLTAVEMDPAWLTIGDDDDAEKCNYPLERSTQLTERRTAEALVRVYGH